MTLEELCENRMPGKTLIAHNWSSYCWLDDDGYTIVNINHYVTQMLQFKCRTRKPYMPIPVRDVSHVDLGYGSKSDQQGMNRIFIKLGLPWFYARRDGSPQIIDLVAEPEHKALPLYMRDPIVRKRVYGYAA